MLFIINIDKYLYKKIITNEKSIKQNFLNKKILKKVGNVTRTFQMLFMNNIVYKSF